MPLVDVSQTLRAACHRRWMVKWRKKRSKKLNYLLRFAETFSTKMNSLPKEGLLEGVEETTTRLGGGGYGSVFLGKMRGSKVAIKRLHESLMGLDENNRPSKEFLRFIEEFPTLCKFAHPAIVQVFGMIPPSSPRSSHGVVMELLKTSLKARCTQQPFLTASQEIAILQNIASGIDYLHSKSYLHRDITTSNVMLTNAGAESDGVLAKIVDVGITRALADSAHGGASLTSAPGQPSYMAPETYSSSGVQSVRYGRPSDIYAIGVTAMAMLNRREPPSVHVICREGRVRDISALDKSHPMYAQVKACVADVTDGRPTASQLCERLSVIQDRHAAARREPLRSDPSVACAVVESMELNVSPMGAELQRVTESLILVSAERDGLSKTMKEMRCDASSMQAELQSVTEDLIVVSAERDRLSKTMERTTDSVSSMLTELERVNKDLTSVTAERDRLSKTLENATGYFQQKLATSDEEPHRLRRHLTADRRRVQHSHDPALRKVVRNSQRPLSSSGLESLSDDIGVRARCQRLYDTDGVLPIMKRRLSVSV